MLFHAFSIFVYTLQMPNLLFIVVGFQISSASRTGLKVTWMFTYFQAIGAVCSPPLSSHISLVTGEVPSEACEGGDPVTLTSSQLGKGTRDLI